MSIEEARHIDKEDGMNRTNTKNLEIVDKVYWILRALVLLSVVFLFIPGINPARISELIGRNLSLFTCSISYSSLVADFGRAFKKEWVDPSTMKMLYFSAVIIGVGVVGIAANGCMSLGNNKLRRLGNKFSIVGTILGILGLAGIYIAYLQVASTSNPAKVGPLFQIGGYGAFLVLYLVILGITIALQLLLPKGLKEDKYEMETKYKLFVMLLPFIILTFVFSYLPLWGWRYAFFDYKPGDTLSSSNYVGFKWFTELFKNPATVKDIVRVLKNTLAMSGLGIATSWCAVVFAIFLSEIKSARYRRFIQVFTTIPNFISWVLVYAIAFCIFSTDGFISSMLVNMGIWQEGTNMLMGGGHVWLKMLAWGMWKGLGWSAIIYIAAISGIDQQLYEAATVDGAGRFQKMWHITVPGLIPTYCVLLLMSVANVLSNGMEQYLVFKNATNMDSIQVLDLYIYTIGIVGKSAIPFTTVVGMMKSIISITLLFGANRISKMIRGESIV